MRGSLSAVWLEPCRGLIVEAMETTYKLVIIVGSVREGRFGPVVASWVAKQACLHGGFDVQVVDLADVDVPLELPAASPSTRVPTVPARPGCGR